jgi:hypothetical protein
MSILNKEIKIVRKSGNERKYEKQVAEVNRLIALATDEHGDTLSVVDESSTWQAPTKYSPFKYVNGVLYGEDKTLDLYRHNRGEGHAWKTDKWKVKKMDMYFDNPLPTIARQYRKVLKQNNIAF